MINKIEVKLITINNNITKTDRKKMNRNFIYNFRCKMKH